MEKGSDVGTTARPSDPDTGSGISAVALDHCAKLREVAEVS